MRKCLEFAEIRRRLQDAEVELVKVLEVSPEVDLSSRARVPERQDVSEVD